MSIVKKEQITVLSDVQIYNGVGEIYHEVGKSACVQGRIHWKDIPKFIEFLKVVHREEEKYTENLNIAYENK